jgi:anaerobic selenocysteine-containing dehydrogenase
VNYAYLNPDDLADLGIAEGDRVSIASAYGAVNTVVRAEERLRRGVVSMTHMFGPLVGTGDLERDGGANLGQLTSLSEHVQPINFMPRFSAVPVSIERAAAPTAA